MPPKGVGFPDPLSGTLNARRDARSPLSKVENKAAATASIVASSSGLDWVDGEAATLGKIVAGFCARKLPTVDPSHSVVGQLLEGAGATENHALGLSKQMDAHSKALGNLHANPNVFIP